MPINLNKKSVVALVAILFAIGGGGYWYLFMRGGNEEETPPPDTAAFTGTIAEVLETGESMKCTWQDGDDVATIFVDGDRYRGEVTSDGVTIGYLYIDGCLYQWKGPEERGFKMCWESEDTTSPVLELSYTYACQPSPVTDSFFTPPAEVEF